MADSAAATVRMKNTNTCPREVAEVVREGDEVQVHREQHQLDRHQEHDDVACRLRKIPTTLTANRIAPSTR